MKIQWINKERKKNRTGIQWESIVSENLLHSPWSEIIIVKQKTLLGAWDFF